MKAYPVGRYADPSDPSIMHEAHTIYLTEQSPNWNLNPNEPTAVPLGPTIALDDPPQQTTVLSGELEQKVEQQNQLLQTTYEQNKRLGKEIQKLRAETQTRSEKAQQEVEANENLQKQLADQKVTLDEIQKQLTKKNAEPPKPATPPQPPSQWWEVWKQFQQQPERNQQS